METQEQLRRKNDDMTFIGIAIMMGGLINLVMAIITTDLQITTNPNFPTLIINTFLYSSMILVPLGCGLVVLTSIWFSWKVTK